MTPEIKKDWLQRATAHAAADRFIKGTWLNGVVGEFKSGCFFGCMTQSEENTLSLAAKQMNSPEWIVHVAERIFEGLPEKESDSFPVDYMNCIPDELSSDQYEEIRHKLGVKRMARMYALVDAIETQEDYKQECLDAITLVSDYHSNPLAERSARSAELAAWSAESSARSAAWSAESAAWSAARSAESAESAESAARSAAWSAESSAESAAESAESAESAAESAAESNEYINERDDLFSIFAEYSV